MRPGKNTYFQIGCIQQISILFTFCEITVPQPSARVSQDIITLSGLNIKDDLEYELRSQSQNHHRSVSWSGGLQRRMAPKGQTLTPKDLSPSFLPALDPMLKKALKTGEEYQLSPVWIINEEFLRFDMGYQRNSGFSSIQEWRQDHEVPRVDKQMGGNTLETKSQGCRLSE